MTSRSHWFTRARRYCRFAVAKSNAFELSIAFTNMQRLYWASLVIVPLNLVHVAVFWGQGWPEAPPPTLLWARLLGWMHLLMAACMGTMGLTARWAHRQTHPGRLPQALTWTAALAGLGFSAGVATVDQWVTPNITPFLIGSLLVSILFGLRPYRAALVYLVGFALFFAGMGFTQTEPAWLLSNRINGLSVVAVSLLISASAWGKSTETWLLRRRLGRQHAVLGNNYRQLQVLASHDRLTGLLNREAFVTQAEAELARAARYAHESSMIVADLDFFKRVNDSHGHPAGDQVLRKVAALLKQELRSTDLIGRLGGEEFIVLLPHTTANEAALVAEKIRMRVASTEILLPTQSIKLHVTISLGVDAARWGQHTQFASLYAAADSALYQAKQNGRNRVSLAARQDGGTEG